MEYSDLDVKNDYETNNKEDDPIDELIVLPKSTTEETHRRIIAMSLGTRKINQINNCPHRMLLRF